MNREELSEQFFNKNRAMHRLWQAYFMRHVHTAGLSGPQLWLLKTIKEYQPISGKDLAEKTHVSRSAITQMLDDISEHIERTPDKHDRRITCISLSDKGRARVDDFEKQVKQLHLQALNVLDDEELAVFVQAQSKMLTALEAHLNDS